MAQESNVNDRLNNAMYGTPQTLPDQRRQFLGSLRERVLMEIDVRDLNNPRTFQLFQAHLTEFRAPEHTALVNGKIDHQLTGPFLKELAQANFPFTLVNKPETPDKPESVALLIVNASAVDKQTVNLLAQHPLTTPTTPASTDDKPKKKGFFERLF